MATDGSATVEELGLHDHACWVSTPGEQQRARLTRYLAAGLALGERVGFFGAPYDRVDVVATDLANAGVSIGTLVDDGQLVFASAEEQYLSNGSFEALHRLDAYAAAVRGALDDGFRGLRVAADVDWLSAHPQAQPAWPGYEFGADVLATRLPFTALCIYDPRHWQSEELALIASLHARQVDYPLPHHDTCVRVAVRRDGSIQLVGELDMTDAPRLGEIVEVALRHSGVTVLDLSELTFVDVAGMRMIATTCTAMIRERGVATIRGASASFRRMWQLAGFDTVPAAIVVE